MKNAPKAGEPGRDRAMNSFCAVSGDVLMLNVLGAHAKRDCIGKVKGPQLKVGVAAAPVAGKATDRMVKFLAGEFGVKPRDIEIVSGRFNENKLFRIKSPKKLPAVVAAHLSRRT